MDAKEKTVGIIFLENKEMFRGIYFVIPSLQPVWGLCRGGALYQEDNNWYNTSTHIEYWDVRMLELVFDKMIDCEVPGDIIKHLQEYYPGKKIVSITKSQGLVEIIKARFKEKIIWTETKY